MALENITGNLLAYKKLEPCTFQHSDQLTTERRTNHGLRSQCFYTADGELYTVQKEGHLWGITRESQNLVLQNIDEVYRELTSHRNCFPDDETDEASSRIINERYGELIGHRNYFPEAEAGQASLKHEDTVIVNLKGLELVKDNYLYGHFVVCPKKLNSEQRRAAQRIYGPDENNFGLNMEMFAEAGKTPHVFVLMPDYVQSTLRSNDKEFIGLASWLDSFNSYSNFGAVDHSLDLHSALRGVMLCNRRTRHTRR